jgi:hypothetical protein
MFINLDPDNVIGKSALILIGTGIVAGLAIGCVLGYFLR